MTRRLRPVALIAAVTDAGQHAYDFVSRSDSCRSDLETLDSDRPQIDDRRTSSREPPMKETTNTVRLHRVLRAPAERIYRAFLDPLAMCKWLPPHGFVGQMHEMDARVGGVYRMSFVNFGNGQEHSFGGKFVELVPNLKLRYTDVFDDPNLPGTMMTTVVLREVIGGTDVSITQEGLPAVIPVEMCYMGWQQSLELLASLVEAEIPS